MNKIYRFAAFAVCCLAPLGVASAATIGNPSFEAPVVTNFSYVPVDLSWTFTGRAGIAANTFFTGTPPQGNQVAFIQQYLDQPSVLSNITQSLTSVALAPSTLTFFMAQRPGFSADPIVVTYDTQNLGTFTPSGTGFSMVTINFTPLVATGVLKFQSAAITSSDLDTAIDLVSFTNGGTATPEPTSLLLIVPTLAGMLMMRRRRLS